MIFSKLDIAHRQKLDARDALYALINTQRGSKEARTEALCRYRDAVSTGVCPGCGGPLFTAPIDNGYCRSCNSKLGRMMTYKSKLHTYAPIGTRATEKFIEDYTSIKAIPYALRGGAEKQTVLDAACRFLEATRREEKLIRDTRMNIDAAHRQAVMEERRRRESL